MAHAYNLACARCSVAFIAAHPSARTCSDACRAALYRARLTAQRQRLAAEADAALCSGNAAALEFVARRAVELLKP